MRVIVIGASSFIGFNFFKYLKQKKINTIGTYFKNRKKLELVKFDITKNKIKNAIKDISQKDIFIIFSTKFCSFFECWCKNSVVSVFFEPACKYSC